MRIAFLSDRSYPYFKGGAEKRYWEIAKRLQLAGHEVHFYTGRWPGMPHEIVIDGITLHGTYTVRQFYVNGHKSIRETLLYSLSLLPYLLTEKYDLIECEQFPVIPIFVAKLAALIRRKPLSVSWLEVWDKSLWQKYLGRKGVIGALIDQIAVHLPNLLISGSPQTTEKLIEHYWLSADKITTLSNGIDLDLIRRTGPADESSDVIFVGRLIDHKKVDVLLRVIHYVKRARPEVRCLIVGDGPERTRLEALSKALGLEQNVRFVGFQKDDSAVYSYLKASRLFLFPSTREGFGIAVIEANACGIPALVVDDENNGSRKLIKPGINGYVCPLDPAALGEKVIEILQQPPDTYRDGCIRESQAYSWDAVAYDAERAYQRLVPPAPKPQIGPIEHHQPVM